MGRDSVGVDIGASKIRVCVVSEDGEMRWKKSAPLGPSPSQQSITASLHSIVKEIDADFSFAGVGVAGFVSTPNGNVIKMPNAGIGYFPVADIFAGVLRRRPLVVNDAVAAVYGEATFLQTDKDIVYLTISSGIGGAAMLNGRVVAGREGNAHEVGHIVIDYERRVACGCGGRGHWEAYCSGSGIPKFARWFAHNSPSEKSEDFLKRAESVTSTEVFDLAKKGDPSAREVVRELIAMNAAGLASVVNVYDPSLMVVGGGVAFGRWTEYISPSFREAGNMMLVRAPRLRKASLDDFSTAYGAAMLARVPGALG